MKTIKIAAVLIILVAFSSGCSAREYHRYQITNSLQVSRQNYHIEALRALEAAERARNPQSFPEGMGAFTFSKRK